MTEIRPTSRKRKISAVKEEATRLHSQIVRALNRGGICEAYTFRPDDCAGIATDASHIIPRVFAHTRTDTDNAFALCAQCHRRFTNHADEWMAFIDSTIGRAEYERLKRKAEDGVNVKFDWFDELDRLKALQALIGRAA